MPGFLVTLVITAIGLFVISRLNLGLQIGDLGTTLLAALVLGLLNAIVRPILGILSLPITILTLGLFALVLNALMILLMARIVPGVHVNGFLGAVIASVALSVLTWLISKIIK